MRAAAANDDDEPRASPYRVEVRNGDGLVLLSAPAEFLAMARAAGEPMTRRQLAGDVAVYLYIPRPRSRAAWRDFHTLRDLAALGGLPVRFERFLS